MKYLKNNKGFTLIELLAVIVILAIIALIATPIILGVIENAKKGAAANSALGYIDALEKDIARKLVNNPTYEVPSKINSVDTSVKGDKPANVDIILNKGNVVSGIIEVNGYTVVIENSKVVSTIKRDDTIYKEPGVNYPEFAGTKLIPVTIEDDGTVKKADLNNIWYSYATKKWANAVVLTDNKSYNAGDTIPESNIDSYLVWIPRYSYAVPTNNGTAYTKGNEQEILINFVDSSVKENGTGKDGSYYTHPAFTFDNELKGIWVGKFELTGTITNPTIKPNVTSLRSQTVKAFYDAILVKKTSYGVTDSHMIKNTEWGAVALLTQSKYGRCTNSKCEEVNRNNNSSFITGSSTVNVATTGYSATSSVTNEFGTSKTITQPYNTEIGYKASTTGNIYGIYDMSGGAWEYVMGYTTLATTVGGSSGFGSNITNTSILNSKYINIYPNQTGIKGDATNSDGTSGWYGDYAFFAGAAYPFFRRGGGYSDGTGAGVFYFHYYSGSADDYSSSRSVSITH